ncbi:hypothetical protein A3Q56_08663 [Intoshia linei]|uniref:RNA-dependent RNA polymerase alsuviricetes domain-containing protein n=1 Tax=Intoshia linei TaxID=1819745 RepID=A0A177AQH6_9BILA|nr:hypothetical protein A3Q56_08663 [Intoshia linei]
MMTKKLPQFLMFSLSLKKASKCTIDSNPIFRSLLNRFRKILKPSICLVIGYGVEKLENFSNTHSQEKDKYIEIDMSSFDKSQNALSVQSFMYLCMLLGLPKEFAVMCYGFH